MVRHIYSKLRSLDQRYFQIIFLSSLLCIGFFKFHISHITIPYVSTIVVSSQIFQYIFSWMYGIKYDFRSPLISSIGLSLLLSSFSLSVGIFAAFLAISSKFIISVKKKHIFNPANFALVICLLLFSPALESLPGGLSTLANLTPESFSFLARISPDQWGMDVLPILSASVFMAGIFVTGSVRIYSISFAFLLSYAILFPTFMFLKYNIIIHDFSYFFTVPLILFSFFMISDPRTTPNNVGGKILFGFLCAFLGCIFYFYFSLRPGFVYSLFFLSLFTPLIDKYMQGKKFDWKGRKFHH